MDALRIDHDLPTTDNGLLALTTINGTAIVHPRSITAAAKTANRSTTLTELHLETGTTLLVDHRPEAFARLIEANAAPRILIHGEDNSPQIESLDP